MKSKNSPRLLVTAEGKSWLVKNLSQDFHTQFGVVSKAALQGKSGAAVVTNKGVRLMLVEPSFIDLFSKMKRGPQIIPRKDVGLIVSETGVGKKSVVVDAGGGSGALCLSMANICKKVTAYEVREDFFTLLTANKAFLDVGNLSIKRSDVYEGIAEKNVDLVTLDLPEPWKAVLHASGALRIGGFLVVYTPTVPQLMDTVSAVKQHSGLVYLKAVELLEREWELVDRKVRPKSLMMGHSGFLLFARKIAVG